LKHHKRLRMAPVVGCMSPSVVRGGAAGCAVGRGTSRGAAPLSSSSSSPASSAPRRANRFATRKNNGGGVLSCNSMFADSEAFGELLISEEQVVLGVGSQVKVTCEVRIFHLSGCGPDGYNLEGEVGEVVDMADDYKGRPTTATHPFKIRFELEPAPGKKKKRKVFAHLTKFEIEAVKTVI